MKLHKILILVAILIVAGYLIFQASTSVMNPYIPIHEVTQYPDRYLGKDIQIIGNVSGPFSKGSQGMEFALTDGSASIRVSYSGPIPSNFMEGIRIVVIGRVTPDGSIAAEQILTKCPSKYAT